MICNTGLDLSNTHASITQNQKSITYRIAKKCQSTKKDGKFVKIEIKPFPSFLKKKMINFDLQIHSHRRFRFS